MRQTGYSAATAKNPNNLTNSKAFEEEILPDLLDQLDAERQAVIQAQAMRCRRYSLSTSRMSVRIRDVGEIQA